MIIVYNSLWKVYSVLLGIFIFLIKFSNGIPIYIHDGRHNLTGEEYDPEDAIFVSTNFLAMLNVSSSAVCTM